MNVLIHLFVHQFLIFLKANGLSFSVILSPKLSQHYHGQLLAYYTFVDGAPGSVSFEVLQGQPDPSARLYLFALGTQQNIPINVDSACEHFYRLSIHNVSLAQTQSQTEFGSFSGHFPTFLVFANDCTCKRKACSSSDAILTKITILNPNKGQLSGSLTGLRAHLIGLLLCYILGIFYALYFVRLAICCSTGYECFSESLQCILPPRFCLKPINYSIHMCRSPANNHALDAMIENTGNIGLNKSRTCATRVDSDERRLYFLTFMLFIQLASVTCVWLELSRLENLGSQESPVTQPILGADGFYSHIAELLAVLNQFAMLRWLLIQVSELNSQHKVQPDSRQSCFNGIPSSSSTTMGRFAMSFSIFRFGRWFSFSRIVNLCLLTQVLWYVFKELQYVEPVYTHPGSWPMEERHGYWVGLGIPTPKYLPPSDPQGNDRFTSTVQFYLAAITWNNSFACLLSTVRTVIGLTLSLRLLRFSYLQRSEHARKVNTNCGWVGLAWFLTHPLLLFIGALFVDHVKYKFTIVGITLAQATIFSALLFLCTRQTFLWDISSLSASLPLLKRTTGSPFDKR